MNQTQQIQQVASYIKRKFSSEGTGHDWYHIERVWKAAKFIAKKEGGNIFVVELAALCHELGDYKLEKDGKERHEQRTREVLKNFSISADILNQVVDVVTKTSFSQNIKQKQILSREGKIVQDADRLEALGAIGLARVFVFSGFKGNPIYDPKIKPSRGKKLQKIYHKAKSTAINHFYEKLLLLKDGMNTKTGKALAIGRHKFLKDYLKQFYKEWKGIAVS